MSNLQLIKAETFNNLPCNFYRNMNDDILLTREQIGQALEYTDPMVAIGKIHNRHSDRLDQFSFTNLVNGHQTYYYTEKGVMEICRWSKSKRANEFMDWVWDIVEKYRHNEFPNLPQITSALALVTNTLTSLTQTVESMQQEINTIKESHDNQSNLPKKKWSYWASKMYPKYQLLTDYFHISNTELYKNLYRELQNTYPDIDLNQEIDDYCYENKFESAYTLDVIEHNLMLRKAYEHIVDTLLDKYNLSDENYETRYATIFDDIPA